MRINRSKARSIGDLAWYGTTDKPMLRLAGPAQDLIVPLQRGYSIQGTVIDELGEAPAEPVEIRIDLYVFYYYRSVKSGHAGDNRAFSFGHLCAGTYRVWLDGFEDRPGASALVEVGRDHTNGVSLVKLVVPNQ